MHWTMHYDGTILNFGLAWKGPGLQSRILFFWDYSKVGLGMGQRWLGLKQFGGWGCWRSYACGDVNVWVSSYIGLRKQEGLSHMSGKEYSNGYKWCTSVDVMMGNTWSNCLSKGGRHTHNLTQNPIDRFWEKCVSKVWSPHTIRHTVRSIAFRQGSGVTTHTHSQTHWGLCHCWHLSPHKSIHTQVGRWDCDAKWMKWRGWEVVGLA